MELKRRIFGLDLLRAIAILFVIISHSKVIMYTFLDKTNVDVYFKNIGLIGVEIFFVLSGFLIGGILIRTFNKSDINIKRELYNFWIKRWFRTLPNYWFFLIVNFIFYDVYRNIDFFNYEYLLFLQNFMHHARVPFQESWSLAIEEWFYISVPIVMALFYKIISKGTNKRKIFYSTLFILSVFFLIRFLHLYSLKVVAYSAVSKIVIYHLDSLVYGVLMAYFFFYYNNFVKKYKKMLFEIGLIIFVVVYIEMVLKLSFNSFFVSLFLIPTIDISVMLMLPYFYYLNESEKVERNSILFPAITHISKISYSMYLSNLIILFFLLDYMRNFEKLSGHINSANGFLFWLTFFLLVIVISTITYYVIEKPFLKYRDKFILQGKS